MVSLDLGFVLWTFKNLFFFFLFLSTELPRILPFNRQISQPHGTTLILTCNVLSGRQPLKFEWFKNGQHLYTQKGHEVIDDRPVSVETKNAFSILTLVNLSHKDSGNYSCRVQNQWGFDQQFTALSVKGSILCVHLNPLFLTLSRVKVTK